MHEGFAPNVEHQGAESILDALTGVLLGKLAVTRSLEQLPDANNTRIRFSNGLVDLVIRLDTPRAQEARLHVSFMPHGDSHALKPSSEADLMMVPVPIDSTRDDLDEHLDKVAEEIIQKLHAAEKTAFFNYLETSLVLQSTSQKKALRFEHGEGSEMSLTMSGAHWNTRVTFERGAELEDEGKSFRLLVHVFESDVNELSHSEIGNAPVLHIDTEGSQKKLISEIVKTLPNTSGKSELALRLTVDGLSGTESLAQFLFSMQKDVDMFVGGKRVRAPLPFNNRLSYIDAVREAHAGDPIKNFIRGI